MKIFLDSEFIEEQGLLELISLGMVREDGEELYVQNLDCAFDRANDFVARHVYPSLALFDMGLRCPINDLSPWRPYREIKEVVKRFAPPDSKPEFWGYFADYDWVVFCWLFGAMVKLPKGYPMYCRDIKQLCDSLGNPRLPEQGKGEHNALADARWNKQAYEFLVGPLNRASFSSLSAPKSAKPNINLDPSHPILK